MASAIARNRLLSPISVTQFREHFQRAWAASRLPQQSNGRKLQNEITEWKEDPDGRLISWPVSENTGYKYDDLLNIPRRLALAVSGGADSMALAYLCRQLEAESVATANAISVTAFVVDHRAREESSREASKVAGWLSDMGLRSQVLELDWSHLAARQDQELPSAFETYARQLRYQILGTACRENGVEALLMGQHRNDNTETIIWRLCSGARGAGLTGIPQVARIPECHGLYGVAESGSSIKVYSPRKAPQVRLNLNNKGTISFPSPADSKDKSKKNKISIASGGILVCRPLLFFPKDSLIATCDENNVPYVSDPTNFDPTLTPRNAIRSLLAANAFPRALQPRSILSLTIASRTLLQRSMELSKRLLESQCRVLNFNFKSGTMVIQFLPPNDSSKTHPLSNLCASRIQEIQAITLRRITELVSPFPANHYSLRGFDPFVSQVFPKPEGNSKPKPFTLGGAMFHPLTPTYSNKKEIPSESDTTSHPTGHNMWLVSRQPFFFKQLPAMRIEIPISDPSHDNSNTFSSSSSSSTSNSDSFTPWTLWDNRYWFRFSISPITLNEGEPPPNIRFVIRPLQESDFEKIKSGASISLRPTSRGRKETHPKVMLSHLRQFLKDEVSGFVRFTVPILAVQTVSERRSEPGSEEEEEDEEQLLAIPTMAFRLTSGAVGETNDIQIYLAGRHWTVKWEWMYKMIDMEALRLMGWHVGPR